MDKSKYDSSKFEHFKVDVKWEPRARGSFHLLGIARKRKFETWEEAKSLAKQKLAERYPNHSIECNAPDEFTRVFYAQDSDGMNPGDEVHVTLVLSD